MYSKISIAIQHALSIVPTKQSQVFLLVKCSMDSASENEVALLFATVQFCGCARGVFVHLFFLWDFQCCGAHRMGFLWRSSA